MNYWLTTDTHFGHAKMLEYCNRPEGFEKLILNHLSKNIQPHDVLIHLGDICMRNDEYWHAELLKIHGKKWLVKGNHDKKSSAWYLEQGWDMVCNSFTLNFHGETVLFSHQPTIENGFTINIHGHFHNTDFKTHDPALAKILTDKHLLLALEFNNYMPWNLETIIKKRSANSVMK